MSTLKWEPSLSVGVEEMDLEHQKLISLMDSLYQLDSQNADFAKIVECFLALKEFTEKHFRDEEAFMKSIDYPDFSTHQLIHQTLLRQIEELEKEAVSEQKLPNRTFAFLNMWLKAHIKGIDMKYGPNYVALDKAS